MTRLAAFVSPFPDGPVVEFLLEGREKGEWMWVCATCQRGGLIGPAAVDAHLAEKHPGWGEARMATR